VISMKIRVGDSIHITDEVVIVINKCRAGTVAVTVSAPKDMEIFRGKRCPKKGEKD